MVIRAAARYYQPHSETLGRRLPLVQIEVETGTQLRERPIDDNNRTAAGRFIREFEEFRVMEGPVEIFAGDWLRWCFQERSNSQALQEGALSGLGILCSGDWRN